jgi:hypothetical protein
MKEAVYRAFLKKFDAGKTNSEDFQAVKVVVDEFKQSGYSITTEILKFTDSGVETTGQYPVE